MLLFVRQYFEGPIRGLLFIQTRDDSLDAEFFENLIKRLPWKFDFEDPLKTKIVNERMILKNLSLLQRNGVQFYFFLFHSSLEEWIGFLPVFLKRALVLETGEYFFVPPKENRGSVQSFLEAEKNIVRLFCSFTPLVTSWNFLQPVQTREFRLAPVFQMISQNEHAFLPAFDISLKDPEW